MFVAAGAYAHLLLHGHIDGGPRCCPVLLLKLLLLEFLHRCSRRVDFKDRSSTTDGGRGGWVLACLTASTFTTCILFDGLWSDPDPISLADAFHGFP